MKGRKNKGNYGKILDNSVRRKNKKARNTAIFLVIVLVLVFLGYSISAPLSNWLNGKETQHNNSSSKPAPTQSQLVSNTSSQKEENNNQISDADYSAVSLPLETAKNKENLALYLDNAKSKGYNAVVLELKDENGKIHYASQNAMAKEVSAITETAITNLSEIVSQIKEKGMTPIANIHAFKDKTATKRNDAKIGYLGQPGWDWWDSANGKPWLNPYSQTAQGYIIDISKELVDLGFANVMVSSIMFPQTSGFKNADFGELSQTIAYKEILAQFTTKLKNALNEKGAKLILNYDYNESLRETNLIYGNANPISFAADIYAPVVLVSAEQSTQQILSELKIANMNAKIMLTFLNTDNLGNPLTADQITAQKKACEGNALYFYNKSGDIPA